MIKLIRVLNLYAGIGGNRKLWENVKVTALEIDENIAKIYKKNFPNDKVIIKDAHKYLLNHINNGFDFIWASPPCPTHSRLRKANEKQNPPIYPDMQLYEEILFLKGYSKCKWVVENVISWYNPMILPYEVGNHYFWSNFPISKKSFKKRGIGNYGETLETLSKDRFKIDHEEYNYVDKRKVLRNCVEPKLALHIFKAAFKVKQNNLEIG